MFNNIGGKIKAVCSLACALGIIGSLLLGLSLLMSGHVVSGTVLAALGSLLAWLSCLALYGFGQLVENSDILAGRMQGKEPEAVKPDNPQGGKVKVKVKRPAAPNAVIFPARTEAEVHCPKCGFAQIGYRDRCRSCGEPFFYEDELE